MQILYPTLIQEKLVQRVRLILDDRSKRLEKIRTSSQAREYCGQVRRKIKRCFGKLPKRTPLNLRVLEETAHDKVVIQRIAFESRPGFMVTGNMYVPDGEGKFPVVLGCCGHAADGKAAVGYQIFCQALARQGYLVLITDPISQGERWQYADDDFPEKFWKGKSCVNEHNIIAKPQRLVGEFFGTWRLWDKIRGLDVLLSHPRADKSRVGVTGNSGGGTLTCYLNALDSRPTMIAPGCFITSYLNNLENSLPCDAEQMIPNMLAGGMDMVDLILANAPRPAIILAQKYDFFDSRGAEEAFGQARKIYRLLGAEENIKLYMGAGNHGYSLENREAMYKFFNKHAGVNRLTKESRLNIKTFQPEELFAGGGDVNRSGSKPAWKFTAEKARIIKDTQPKLRKTEKLKKLEKILKLPSRKKICHYRNSQIGYIDQRDIDEKKRAFMTQYLIETQGSVTAVLNRFVVGDLHKSFNLQPTQDMSLFVLDSCSFDEYDIKTNKILGRKSEDTWALDVRGFGCAEAKSLCYDYTLAHPYGMDYMMATTYDMLGESMLGWRVYDALCSLDLLADNGAKNISLIAKGNAAIAATLAGALHSKVKKLELIDPVESFFEMTQKPISKALFSDVAPSFLKFFDWVDFIDLI